MKLILKATVFAIITQFLLMTFSVSALAQTPVPTPAATSEPTPTAQVEVNSFELFWPIFAGKTADDPVYFLKTLKENIRGMFIFGNPQKAEYNVLLGTKRTLEAEKLLSEGKSDVANKTLQRAVGNINSGIENYTNAVNSNDSLADSKAEIASRIENLLKLTQYLETKYQSDELSKLKSSLTDFSSKF